MNEKACFRKVITVTVKNPSDRRKKQSIPMKAPEEAIELKKNIIESVYKFVEKNTDTPDFEKFIGILEAGGEMSIEFGQAILCE